MPVALCSQKRHSAYGPLWEMVMATLIAYSSLFEIGFALHAGISILESVYGESVSKTIAEVEGIREKLKHLRLVLTKSDPSLSGKSTDVKVTIARWTITSLAWNDKCSGAEQQICRLSSDSVETQKTHKRRANLIMYFSMGVCLYSLALLFIGASDVDFVRNLSIWLALALVVIQLIPMPIAALAFYRAARTTTREGAARLDEILSSKISMSDKTNFLHTPEFELREIANAEIRIGS